MNRSVLVASIGICLWGLASRAEAKNLYVNNSGSPACSDATTWAENSAGSPWCTLGRAAWGSTSYASPNPIQAAQAGDVVLVSAGIYTITGAVGGERWSVALNPANSGTSGNPITFRGVGTVELRMDTSTRGPLIGAYARDYIVWDHFYSDDYYSGSISDTGPVVFHATTGSQLLNSTLVGMGTRQTYYNGSGRYTNNYCGIRIEPGIGVVIRNNHIANFRDINANENDAGIMTYDSRDCIVEHNYFANNGSNIFWKGDHDDGSPQTNNITRFNWIEFNWTNDSGGRGIGIYNYAHTNSKIYQNIIKGLGRGIRQHNNSSQTQNSKIVNNTIIGENGSSTGINHPTGTDGMTGFQGFNNIVYGPWVEDVNIGMNEIGPLSYEHNVYYGYQYWGSFAGATRTFAQWQATGQDSVAPTGINADPLFVNAASNDFHLQAGSPARNRGVDILDLDGDGSTTDIIPAGAYITGDEIIGIVPDLPPTPPAPPRGLQLR